MAKNRRNIFRLLESGSLDALTAINFDNDTNKIIPFLVSEIKKLKEALIVLEQENEELEDALAKLAEEKPEEEEEKKEVKEKVESLSEKVKEIGEKLKELSEELEELSKKVEKFEELEKEEGSIEEELKEIVDKAIKESVAYRKLQILTHNFDRKLEKLTEKIKKFEDLEKEEDSIEEELKKVVNKVIKETTAYRRFEVLSRHLRDFDRIFETSKIGEYIYNILKILHERLKLIENELGKNVVDKTDVEESLNYIYKILKKLVKESNNPFKDVKPLEKPEFKEKSETEKDIMSKIDETLKKISAKSHEELKIENEKKNYPEESPYTSNIKFKDLLKK